MLIFVYTELLTSFMDMATFPLPTSGSRSMFPFKLYVASMRIFGMIKSKLSSFFSRSRLELNWKMIIFVRMGAFHHSNWLPRSADRCIRWTFDDEIFEAASQREASTTARHSHTWQQQWLKMFNSQFGHSCEFIWSITNAFYLSNVYLFWTLTELPLANIGNIPSNMFRKQSFSFGLSRLHVNSQSAGIEWKSFNFMNIFTSNRKTV